jgi:hypothetical protein
MAQLTCLRGPVRGVHSNSPFLSSRLFQSGYTHHQVLNVLRRKRSKREKRSGCHTSEGKLSLEKRLPLVHEKPIRIPLAESRGADGVCDARVVHYGEHKALWKCEHSLCAEEK